MIEVVKMVKIYRDWKDCLQQSDIEKANEEIAKLGGNVKIRILEQNADGETIGFEVE